MRRPIIAGNWKMHKTIAEGRALAKAIAEGLKANDREVVLGPTFTALAAVAEAVAGSPVRVAAQDCYWEEQGAFTGEISPAMIKDAGASYAILGHSERRHLFGETSEEVAKKARAALAAGLRPIVCVGERLEEREAGRTEAVVSEQLAGSLKDVLPPSPDYLIVAYEPVWAIGTGKVATPEQAQEAHAFIRGELGKILNTGVRAKIRILYGGSVKPDNVDGLMAQPDVDGALVGGASLKADDFLRIIHYR